MSMGSLSPVRLGRLRDVARVRLHAALTVGPDAQTPISCTVQLAERDPEGGASWEVPLWEASIQTVDGFVFRKLDGCPAVQRMTVGMTKPTLVVRAVEPIAAIRWRLRNDGEIRERGADEAAGSSEAGRTVSVTPTKALRRSGEPKILRLPAGILKPPFAWRSGRYNGRTYKTETATHSDFAVDFNRFGDEGDPVRAAAGGKVIKRDESFGAITIRHKGGFETLYGHMTHIPGSLVPGNKVRALKRIGRIGTVSTPRPVAPHLHLQHLRNGQPMKMHFDGEPYSASLRSPPLGVTFGPLVRGPKRTRKVSKAAFLVAVQRRDGRWSGFGWLGFVIGASESDGGDCVGAPGDATARVLYAELDYDGDRLLPGPYELRYRCQDAGGRTTEWVHDRFVVTGS